MRPETLHLTLLFLGEVPRQRLPELVAAACNVHAVPFQLVLERVCCWQHNQIGYLAPVQLPEELLHITSELRRHVDAAGFSYDKRAFAAHVTLLRNISNTVPSLLVEPVVWDVRQFVLVESMPGESGRRDYQVLASCPLS